MVRLVWKVPAQRGISKHSMPDVRRYVYATHEDEDGFHVLARYPRPT